MDVTQSTRLSFQLKGGLYTLSALTLYDLDLISLAAQLDDKVAQAPKFFQNAPIIIDCQSLDPQIHPHIPFTELATLLKTRALIPVGVKTTHAPYREQAALAGLPWLPAHKQRMAISAPTAEPAQEQITTAAPPPAIPTIQSSKIITTPVRSGQQIYAKGGDLIVLAPVSGGAEILADGHIHVYAPLRGRALAGVNGQSQAGIFCHCLEAELVSIAGQYRLCEDLKSSSFWQQPTRITLVADKLNFSPLIQP